MELGILVGKEGERIHVTVKQRAVDENGIAIGKPSNNPLGDSQHYEIKFVDGKTDIIAANFIV